MNPFELFHQKTKFQVRDYMAVQAHQFAKKPYHAVNDGELAKLKKELAAPPSHDAADELKLKAKAQSAAVQPRQPKGGQGVLGGLLQQISTSSGGRDKSHDDSCVPRSKQYTVDQAMKIPFFVKINEEREKQLRVSVLNHL